MLTVLPRFISIYIIVYSVVCRPASAQEPNILNQFQLKKHSPHHALNDELISSLLNEVEGKTIIGLGEGTHGTAEFNQVRAAISQKLIEERGFQYICFENNYGETFVFNMRFKDLQIRPNY